MSTFEADLQELAQRIQALGVLDDASGGDVKATMQEALDVIKETILAKVAVAPEFRIFRGSFVTALRGVPIHLYGELAAEPVIGTPLDLRLRIGERYPPDILRVSNFLQLKLGIPPGQADQMVNELRVQIPKFNIRVEAAFSDGFDAAMPAVHKLFERLLDTLSSRVMK